MKTNILLLLLLPMLMGASCKKEKLTKETQTGANTFSCKVDGRIMIPNDEAFGAKAVSATLSQNVDPDFYNLDILTNYSKKKPSEKIYITLYKVKKIGAYKLDGAELRFGTYILDDGSVLGGIIHNSRKFNNGEVIITRLDLGIVSGTFRFEAVNTQNPGDKVSITDGRFDLKLR